MSNFHNKTKGWQAVNREIIQDNNLSDRARFLYVYMASKPEDWDFFHDSMKKELGYGEETLRKYLDELIEYGLLIKGEQSNGGRFGATEYTLLDTIPEKPLSKKPLSENSVTENFRNGKNPQQRNKEYIENRENKENKESTDRRNGENSQFEKVTDFDTVFNERAGKMKEDDRVLMQLSGYRITNMDALFQEFKRHIIKNFKQDDFVNNGYLDNCKYLSRAMGFLDLSEATGRKLGAGEYFNERGERCYKNKRGNEIIIPLDAPPRRSENNIWDPQEQRWSIE